MGFKIFCLILCLQFASSAIGSHQNHDELKFYIEELFRSQQTTLNEQQQKIEEYQQQLRNFSESQETLIDTIGSVFLSLDEINEFQKLLETCDESREVLVEKIDKMKVKFSLQREMINNLTEFLETHMDENIRYHENKRFEFSKHQQSILDRLKSIEQRNRKEEEEERNQANNTDTTPDVCAMNYDSGPCLASIPRWYYNSETGQCDQFIYGGCLGNHNNFEDLETCQKNCSDSGHISEPEGSGGSGDGHFTTDDIDFGDEDYLSTESPKLNTMRIHPKSCDDRWEYFNGSCYYFSNVTTNWNQASMQCHFMNAHLAIVTSAAENKHLVSLGKKKLLSKSDGYWFDGTDVKVEGKWIWRTTGAAFTYTNWYNREPNNLKNEDCLEITKALNFSWNDIRCVDNNNQYICEKEINYTT